MKKEGKPEKKNFRRKLRDAIEDSSIKLIITVIGSILLFLMVLLFGYLGAGKIFREAQKVEGDFIMKQHFPVEGIVVDCDSMPIPGIKVVAKGYDVQSALTNENGFFSASMKLPVELDEVQIRFLDSTNKEIYKTLYNLDKNNVENDRILIYPIPDEVLIKSE